ncbi:GPN-loop GTPase 3 [Coccinella septempunctata]|uniref:GPN-loop GTPase 3 n=1 Tax=Coccinella septempunctata TaxID=41139 RepID=UPI001D08ACB6|nr:GPN-loop GTPase 3 [Coccinella septempunctata]
MRYAQLVVGPAGCGKSTYCKAMQDHILLMKRKADVINLDPGAEHFDYEPMIDIRELINVQDAMEDEELHFGPNGGLVFCMEYLFENLDWLQDKLGEQEDEYILFDCPGQIELFTHIPAMRKFIERLQSWNFNVCVVFLIDVQFMTDGPKFISGTMAALSVMLKMNTQHVNILSKMDLLSKAMQKRINRFLDPNTEALLDEISTDNFITFNEKYMKLTESIADIVSDYSLISFVPLNLHNEESMTNALITIDNALQYGENEEVKTRDFEEEDD